MTVNSDNALNCPTKDSFGVAGLAESFANIIMRCDTIEDGLVMAVCGEWGVGKTSFLGFVKTHLNDEEKKPIILDFNPWLFSDRDDLVKRYLIELAKVLSPRQMKRDACRLKFSEAVNNFADISGELLEFAADLAPVPLLATGVRTLKNLSKQSVEKVVNNDDDFLFAFT